jgi:endonuclease YncB( thermonuclease family)
VFRERLVDKFWKFMAHLLMRKGFLIRKSLRGLCQHEKNLALKARDFVRAKLANAKEIKLTNLQRGKYFRVVVDGVSLERELLDNKLAYEYSGGKKLSWCK